MNIDPTKLVVTPGILAMKGHGFDSSMDDYLFEMMLSSEVQKQFKRQPDECYDGGNDKHFFTLEFRGKKLFAAANEVNGLTVMLPEEY